ncbi:hypothetical protein ACUH94_03515 [Dermabacteraceae bacterium P7074]
MGSAARTPLGAALGLLIALAVIVGGGYAVYLVALTCAFVIVMLTSGWPDLLELPTPRSTRLVMALTGIAGLVVALSTSVANAAAGIALVMVFAVFASFLQQMLRPERSQLTESLTGTVTGAILAALSAGWMEAVHASAGIGLIVTAASALVATSFVLALPLPGVAAVPSAIFAGTLVPAFTSYFLLPSEHPLLIGAGVGAVIACLSVAITYLLSTVFRAREARAVLTNACAPVAVTGFVVFLAVRMIPL